MPQTTHTVAASAFGEPVMTGTVQSTNNMQFSFLMMEVRLFQGFGKYLMVNINL